MKTMMLTMMPPERACRSRWPDAGQLAAAMGQAFDASKNDDSFYLPPEAFRQRRLQDGHGELFLSPDGKAVRFIIAHDGDPMTPEGIARIDARTQTAAKEASQGHHRWKAPRSTWPARPPSRTCPTAAKYDLMIAGIASMRL